MSAARIQVEIIQFEAALRPAYDQRGALRSASSSAWQSCLSALLSVDGVFKASSFVSGSGGGSKWVQWRKSNASKQLLGLLRSVIEAAAAAMPAATGSSGVSAGSKDTTDIMATQIAMLLLHQYYSHTQKAALWPALREWLSEGPQQRGLQDMWGALAWSLEATKHALPDILDVYSATRLAILSIHNALQLSLGSTTTGLLLPPRSGLLQHPSLAAALRLILGSALPRLIACSPCMSPGGDKILETSLSVFDSLLLLLAQDVPLAEVMHPLALSLWTDAVAAVRRRPPQTDLGIFLRVRTRFWG